MRWRPVAEELTDHWANIRRLPAGATPGPLDLSGRLDEIVGVYRRIPSGRLVVLGRSGSGKTILAVRFVLSYPAVSSAIIGFGSPEHVDEVTRMRLDEPLPAEFLPSGA